MDTPVDNARAHAPSDKRLWLNADWQGAHKIVRRIQNRIVQATQAKQRRKVRNLQRLLCRSRSAKLLAVKRVTENSGGRTPGIDGKTWDSATAKSKAVLSLNTKSYKANPVKRVYIPKSNGKERPLGIPILFDRAMQALYKMALEPVTETLADKHSYGFRPERCTADAIEMCFYLLSRKKDPEWVLEADIQGCFDNIHHEWLLNHTPFNKRVLKQWLKAGFVEKGTLHPTHAGTPQGGIISPVLMNLTLDGLADYLAERFGAPKNARKRPNRVQLVRYADDFIITGSNRELLEEKVKPAVAEFLSERGLAFSPKKTCVTSIYHGFDFLGQTVRKYRKSKLFITPSLKSQKAFRQKIKGILNKHKASSQETVIALLNPIITGWGNYHKHVVSKEVFSALDNWLWKKLWIWSCRRHRNKTKRWVAKRYYHSIGKRHWEFGYVHQINGQRILKTLNRLAVIPIRYHIKIKGEANPYDSQWELYFEQRNDAKMKRIGKQRAVSLYKIQKGQCVNCHLKISIETGWNIHHKLEKIKGGSDHLSNLVLLHPHCHRQIHSRLKAGLSISDNLSYA